MTVTATRESHASYEHEAVTGDGYASQHSGGAHEAVTDTVWKQFLRVNGLRRGIGRREFTLEELEAEVARPARDAWDALKAKTVEELIERHLRWLLNHREVCPLCSEPAGSGPVARYRWHGNLRMAHESCWRGAARASTETIVRGWERDDNWMVSPEEHRTRERSRLANRQLTELLYGGSYRSHVFSGECSECGRVVWSAQPISASFVCSNRCAARRRRARNRASTPQVLCSVCEREFTPRRSDAKFCSNACRQEAYRRRKHGGPA